MIKLSKTQKPKILVDKEAEWTKAVLDAIAAGKVPKKSERNRYNHPDVKKALLEETGSKCAYCESYLRHISYGDIEHITPKSEDPKRWFDWTNLTLACDVCNTKKSSFGADSMFVDPYEVDPEKLFLWLGPLVKAIPGAETATFTEKCLELNRPDLIERRMERIESLLNHFCTIVNIKSDVVRRELWLDFCKQARGDVEYAALSRKLIKEIKAEQLSALNLPPADGTRQDVA